MLAQRCRRHFGIFPKGASGDGGDFVNSSSSTQRTRALSDVQQWPPGGWQKPRGACGATWMLGAFAFAMLAPTKAAETAKTAASAILLSMGSPCGFVDAV